MSKEAVNRIIERAVKDEAFFEHLRTDPAAATAGFDLDEAEQQAFAVGAYNVIVRSTRREREESARLVQNRAADFISAAPALSSAPPPPVPSGRSGAGAIVSLVLLVVVLGGVGGFRYFERQWPWQAFLQARTAAPASIPKPTLGARPTASAGQGSSAGSSRASVPTSAAPSSAAAPASGSTASSPGQAQLRATPAPSSSSPAEALAVQKAYYEKVSQRLQAVITNFGATLTAIRDGNDATQPLSKLTSSIQDLNQELPGAVPPDDLKQQHQVLEQSLPLLQADVSQMKDALGQKNQVQAILIASEMQALFRELQDEVTFASAPHPDFYQPLDTKQVLQHVLAFDVVRQNVTQQGNGASSVQLAVAVRSPAPSPDEVTDTLHHGIVVARQSYPQATQVQVVGYKEVNGAIGPQVGTADWYCGPESLPSGASSSAKWQNYCGRVYVTIPPSSTAKEIAY